MESDEFLEIYGRTTKHRDKVEITDLLKYYELDKNKGWYRPSMIVRFSECSGNWQVFQFSVDGVHWRDCMINLEYAKHDNYLRSLVVFMKNKLIHDHNQRMKDGSSF